MSNVVPIRKTDWRNIPGEWNNEPDFSETEYLGYHLVIRRNKLGVLCGYVGVKRNHPFFRKTYTDYVESSEYAENRPIDLDKVGVLNLFWSMFEEREDGKMPVYALLDVHGGITYAGYGFFDWKFDVRYSLKFDWLRGIFAALFCDKWYFGFDCGHCNDFVPELSMMGLDWGVYRNFEYVKNQCESLARQLKNYETR